MRGNLEQHRGVEPLRLHGGHTVKAGGEHFVLIEHNRACAGKAVQNEGVLHDNAALQRTEEPGKVHKRQRRKESRRAGNDEENERAVNGFLGRDRGEDQKEKRDQDTHTESERGVNSRIAFHRIGLGAIDSLRIGNGVDLAGENGIGGGGEHRAAHGSAAVDSARRDLLSGRDFAAGGMPEDRGEIERDGAFQNFEIGRSALAAFENKDIAKLDILRRNGGLFLTTENGDTRHIGVYTVAEAGLRKSGGVRADDTPGLIDQHDGGSLIAFVDRKGEDRCNGNEQLLPETVFPDEPDAGLIQHVKTADERTEQQQEKRYTVSQLQKETETEQNGGNADPDKQQLVHTVPCCPAERRRTGAALFRFLLENLFHIVNPIPWFRNIPLYIIV